MERMFLLGHPFSLDTLVGCALRTLRQGTAGYTES